MKKRRRQKKKRKKDGLMPKFYARSSFLFIGAFLEVDAYEGREETDRGTYTANTFPGTLSILLSIFYRALSTCLCMNGKDVSAKSGMSSCPWLCRQQARVSSNRCVAECTERNFHGELGRFCLNLSVCLVLSVWARGSGEKDGEVRVVCWSTGRLRDAVSPDQGKKKQKKGDA